MFLYIYRNNREFVFHTADAAKYTEREVYLSPFRGKLNTTPSGGGFFMLVLGCPNCNHETMEYAKD